MCGDFGTFAIGFYIALALRKMTLPTGDDVTRHATLFFVTFILWILVNYINGLYDVGRITIRQHATRRLVQSASASLVIGVIFFYVLPSRDITPKTILLLTVICGYALSALWRFVALKMLETKRLTSRIVCVGYTSETQELIDILTKEPERGYTIVGIVDTDHTVSSLPKGVDVTNSLDETYSFVLKHQPSLIVVAPHIRGNQEAMRALYQLLFLPMHVVDLIAFYETVTGRIPPSVFSESWFLEHLKEKDHSMYEKWQVIVDCSVGVLLGVLFLVFLPLVAVVIKLTSPGPIFFKQQRVGKHGDVFTLYKFRSMYALSADGSAETGGYQFATKKDTRVTPVGRVLRRTRIDELPQVLNLFKRDMSVIGPRPERPEIVADLTKDMSYYPLRHIVRPGLTGWAVLHQHYADTHEKSLEKLQYDLYYIQHRSIILDLSILLRTLNIVFRLMGQ
ncbi:MAG: hypothetical protein A3J66_00560 [Candidatus Magasanikbacteria bacterium RIFCSPHIGHO2_02_FULL_47_14]|uniref:Bacterial sugar transferase domain-containing protein n=1 Tax=Candidatus Magasanikbacteria bacterium RIFCSPHIGHO2_02_FULL_47_14 TaxID=1798680 RepID=A0A1F6MA58_9BACT|nr:MAG: hypothetical protein A3J66_00560 [Candidatus Magasanikbacteria bacterium RIFCSPHIGHO2_02_FULL_47_14]